MNEVDKIVNLLSHEAIEKRIAAAIVLGELRPKGAGVAEALGQCLESGIPLLQRHALESLAEIGPKKILSKIFPLLVVRDEAVRRAATRAIASMGEDVLPLIRPRMATASTEERRALDAILAEVGGKDAFHTLLRGLTASDAEAAKAAALAVRQQVKNADGRQRRSYLAEIEKFLKHQGRGGGTAAIAAAIKILGYLEDEKAIPTLLVYAADKAQANIVRQEAIIALRFALGQKAAGAKVIQALVAAAEADDRTLAQTALHTLGSLELPPDVMGRLEKLAFHADPDRARFVIEHLGRQPGPEAARVLVTVLSKLDRRRAEMATQALQGREEAAPYLAKALLDTKDPDRAWMLRNVLRPMAKKTPPSSRKQMLEGALERMNDGDRGWEPLLDIVREADPDATAHALRELGSKLRRTGKHDKALAVLRVLCNMEKATDEDRYAFAALELARGVHDTRPASRAGDDSLRLLGQLLGRGFDVAKALRKDRALELEHLYYVGFHFTEEGHPVGEELLQEVVKKGGRAKLARMAKNKLQLSA